MNANEQQKMVNAVNNGTAQKMRYTGEPTLTRGEFGETVEFGYSVDGYVYVWDSTFGWSLWSSVSSAPFILA